MIGEAVELFDANQLGKVGIADEEERRTEIEQADESTKEQNILRVFKYELNLLFIRKHVVPLQNVFWQRNLASQKIFPSSEEKSWFAIWNVPDLEVTEIFGHPLVNQKSDND